MGAVMLVCLSCSHFSGSLSPCLSAGPVSPVLRSNVELRGGYHEYTEVQSCQDVVYLYHLLWSATILNIIALFLGIITAAVLGGFKDMVRAKDTRVVGWEGMCVLVSWELVKKLAVVKSQAEPLCHPFLCRSVSREKVAEIGRRLAFSYFSCSNMSIKDQWRIIPFDEILQNWTCYARVV